MSRQCCDDAGDDEGDDDGDDDGRCARTVAPLTLTRHVATTARVGLGIIWSFSEEVATLSGRIGAVALADRLLISLPNPGTPRPL
jgi:hypothetical protein